MSQHQKQIIMQAARGSWQYSIARALADGYAVTSPVSLLRGRAKQYNWLYKRSFLNLLDRLERAGIIIERIPGPRGGEYSAQYRVINQ